MSIHNLNNGDYNLIPRKTLRVQRDLVAKVVENAVEIQKPAIPEPAVQKEQTTEQIVAYEQIDFLAQNGISITKSNPDDNADLPIEGEADYELSGAETAELTTVLPDTSPDTAPDPEPEPVIETDTTKNYYTKNGDLYNVKRNEHTVVTSYPPSDRTVTEVWGKDKGFIKGQTDYSSEWYEKTETYTDADGNKVTVITREETKTKECTTINVDGSATTELKTTTTNTQTTVVKNSQDRTLSKTTTTSENGKPEVTTTEKYDEKGNVTEKEYTSGNTTIVTKTAYNADNEPVTGSVVRTQDGNTTVTEIDYKNGIITQTENGITKEVKLKTTEEDDEEVIKATVTYTDENGNKIKQIYEDVDTDELLEGGSVRDAFGNFPSAAEKRNPEGKLIEKSTANQEDGTYTTSFYNADGYVYSKSIISGEDSDDYSIHNEFYDSTGGITSLYDQHITTDGDIVTSETIENGHVTIKTETKDGELIAQTLYSYDDPENPDKITSETVYDSSGNIVSQKDYTQEENPLDGIDTDINIDTEELEVWLNSVANDDSRDTASLTDMPTTPYVSNKDGNDTTNTVNPDDYTFTEEELNKTFFDKDKYYRDGQWDWDAMQKDGWGTYLTGEDAQNAFNDLQNGASIEEIINNNTPSNNGGNINGGGGYNGYNYQDGTNGWDGNSHAGDPYYNYGMGNNGIYFDSWYNPYINSISWGGGSSHGGDDLYGDINRNFDNIHDKHNKSVMKQQCQREESL